MATPEQLLELALGAGKQQIAVDDPYAGLTETGDSISQMFQQATANQALMGNKNGPRDAILGAAISGLFGGAMGNLSTNYKSDRESKYNDLLLGALSGQDVTKNPDVTSALARTAQTEAEKFKTIQGLRAAEDQRTLKNQIALSAGNQLASVPNNARDILSSILGVEVGKPTPIATSAGDNTRGGEGAMLDEIARETNRLVEAGLPPTQAATTARDAFGARKKELENSYLKIDEAEKSGQALLRMVDNLETAVQGAGATGVGGNIRQGLAGLAGELGFEGQASKYAAGKQLDSMGAEIVRNARQIGSGPMSDRDVAMYLSAGPRLNNPEETNQAIIDRMRFAGKLQSKYAEFMRQQRELGVPVNKAEQAWSGVVKENPYLIKDNQTGKLIENPNWQTGIGVSPMQPITPTAQTTSLTLADVEKMTPEQAAQFLAQQGK